MAGVSRDHDGLPGIGLAANRTRGKGDRMKFSSVFSTVAVASVLTFSAAWAASPSAPSGGPAAAIGDPEGATIKGTIASVERESGRFVLDTDEGPISFITSPDELTGVDVGDVVQVSLVSDDD
jgi:hypothetical protein